MFTDLFQLEQKPVTVFSSADAGSPVLTKTPGSLKALLKACLVTGYGSKAGLGWDMAFESADQLQAAFKSTDPTASQFYFKIDNSGASTAKLSAYQEMTDIDTGIKPIVVENIYDLYASEWRLIGHNKAFVLLLDMTLAQVPNSMAYPLLFGDLPRQISHVEPICVLWSSRRVATLNTGGVQSTLFYQKNGSAGANNYGVNNVATYPFRINAGAGAANLTDNFCKFSYLSEAKGFALYEPVMCLLPDLTWTFLPMLHPASRKITEFNNLAPVDDNGIKAVTGGFTIIGQVDKDNNCDCIVPTKWWYA